MRKSIETTAFLNQELLGSHTQAVSITKFAGLALFGCALIVLGSMIKIPLYPISFTLQTLAIYILALTQSPKQAFASALCYLVCATIGFPVFFGHANPFWIIGKSGGYLVAFPLAAYCIAQLRHKHSPITALLCGTCVTFTLGFLWLIPFFGLQVAFTKGVLIFIPSELFKVLAAIHLVVRNKNSWSNF